MFSMNRFEGTSAMQTPFPPGERFVCCTPSLHQSSFSLSRFTLAKPVDSTSAWRRINVVKAAPLRPSSRYFGGEVSGVPRSLGRRTFSNEVARKLLPTIPPACDLRLRCFSAKTPRGAIRNSIPSILNCSWKRVEMFEHEYDRATSLNFLNVE